MFFQLLDNDPRFPDPALAEPDGLLAVGGDLSLERLLNAYGNGIFPWYSEDEPVLWYSPHERCVIYPDKITISKSMEKLLKRQVFRFSMNEAFNEVILNCAQIKRADQDGTWITGAMQKAYQNLHKKGFAHSVEVWQEDKLAGGLYGVKINNVFCGESMFSRVSNASKAALIYLCKTQQLDLVDCQIPNPHLMSMGARMLDRAAYMEYLRAPAKQTFL